MNRLACGVFDVKCEREAFFVAHVKESFSAAVTGVYKLPMVSARNFKKIGATLGQDPFRAATRQGCSECSLHQERCNLAVVLLPRGGQWVVAPLIFDGGVGARLQQDPDDSDVALVGSLVDSGSPSCRQTG